MGCVAFGACCIEPSATRTEKGGDRSVSPYLDLSSWSPAQARSQDFVKGGLFWKVETTVSDLDPNFHCS